MNAPAPALVRPSLVEDEDLQASPLVAWILDVELPRPMHRDRFMPLFPPPWRLDANVSLHAFCPDTGLWTYPDSAGVPERYTRLQLAVALVGGDPRDEEGLAALLAEVRARLAGAGITEVTPRTPVADAVARAEVLEELVDDLEEAHAGALLAPVDGGSFALTDVRRVGEALRLAEGDLEDGFAWLNRPDAPGDEALFTMVPELEGDRIVALRFALHVGRTAAPAAIFDQLLAAARYAQSELGGTLTGLEGEPLDPDATRDWIERVVRRVRATGLEPGAHATMTIL